MAAGGRGQHARGQPQARTRHHRRAGQDLLPGHGGGRGRGMDQGRGQARTVAVVSGAVSLASFNAAATEDAVAVMISCCSSRRFAAAMAAGRPYASLAAAEAAVTVAFESLDWADVLEAIAGHPRIGDRAAGQSAAEQSGVADSSRAALADRNRAYEARFCHVFLI